MYSNFIQYTHTAESRMQTERNRDVTNTHSSGYRQPVNNCVYKDVVDRVIGAEYTDRLARVTRTVYRDVVDLVTRNICGDGVDRVIRTVNDDG